ncbi:MAG TPA: ABC transporter ATP-binding protein, partial [Roseiflexaceae bacterium]|nr:ABC transporter ATP-binding protein [Roseiflexaceae bacterium]
MPRLYSLVRPYGRTVIAGMVCLILSVIAELYPPLIWQKVVDEGLAQRDWNLIVQQIVLLVGVLAASQAFSAIRGVLLERAGQQLTMDLRLRVYHKLQAQSASYYANRRTGDLLSRLTSDVDVIQDVLIRGTDSVVANALRLIGVASIFIVLQPTLGIITIMPMLLVGLLLTRYNKRVRPVYRAAREKLGEVSARLADNLGGIRVIQVFAQERREMQAVEAISRRLYHEQVRAVTMRNRVFPFIRWIGSLGNATMLGGGVYFILQGQFTVGGLLAYRGYGRYFFGPVDDLVNINDLLQRAAAAGRRLFEVLDAPIQIEDASSAHALVAPPRGDIRFEGVTFGYDPRKPVLRDVHLHIRPGERVAILGPSGAGKSTLLALAARVYDPDCGRITLDGEDLRCITLVSLRSQIAQVQQETYLFNTTIFENLRYGRPDATPEQVYDAARAANAHDFIEQL